MNYNTNEIIKLDANENPLGCSKKIYDNISNMNINLYPEVFCPRLRKTIADKHGFKTEQIFCGNGSDNLIRVITQALVRPGEEIIIPEVAFPTYQSASNMIGAKSVLVPLKNHAIDLIATIEAITDNTKLIWLSNPHNPTGTIFNKKELENILDKIPSNVFFVMDEAYIELADDKDCPNSLDYIDKYPNMITLRTFSKAYGLASLRVGYGIADVELVKILYTAIGVYDVSHYAQECAILAIQDDKFIDDVRSLYREEKNKLYSEFKALNLEYIESYANFIMVYLGTKELHVADELRKRNIFIKAGSHIGMKAWIRVSIGTPDENRIFIENLKDMLKSF
jgi:histidinol-phosphate aminotransferase